MLFNTLYWREPLWLITIILPCIFIFITYYKQNKSWRKIADAHLLPWLQSRSETLRQRSRQRISQFLLAISWLLFSIALAGPRTAQWIPPSLQTDDVSVMVIIDFSDSMKAADVKINRIAQAQALLKHWLNDRSESQHSLQLTSDLRMGLIIYSGHSHTLLIPTFDKALVKHFTAQLQQFKAPTLGNNLSASLQTASALLKNYNGKRYILLLSDGDLGKKEGDAAKKSASLIQSQGLINLSVIGAGQTEAVRIPAAGRHSLAIDGKVIVSRRQIVWLKQFTELAGGRYYNAESAEQYDLAHILDLPEARIDPQFNHQVLWDEWFFIPLLSGMFLSLLALQISGRTAYTLTVIALLSFLSGCNISDKSDNSDQRLRFSQGAACYQIKDYVCAQQLFSALAWSAEDKKLQRRAVFNLANTHFKLGDYEQASVLFKDAERLGVAPAKTRINQQFSDSLAAAVRQRLENIAKTKQRADWLSSARKLPEGFEDRMADGLYLPQLTKSKTIYFGLSAKEQQLLIEQGVKRIQTSRKAKPLGTQFWVLSVQDVLPQQTSGLFNSLMPFETGLHYIPDEPVQIEGRRPW